MKIMEQLKKKRKDKKGTIEQGSNISDEKFLHKYNYIILYFGILTIKSGVNFIHRENY